MARTPAARRPHAVSSLVVAVLCLVGCGGTATPPPSEIVPPRPTDASAALLKIIAAPDFGAVETFRGTIKVDMDQGVLSGTGAISGGDSTQTMTIAIANTTRVTHSTDIGSTSWTRAEPGPWLEDPKATTPKKTLSDYLRSLTEMVDLGLVPRPGRMLHHIQSTDSIAVPAEDLGYGNGPTTKDGAFTADFYATDNGTPVTIVLAGTWTVLDGSTERPASVTYDDTLSQVGTVQRIAPPDDIWVRYTSKALGYSMAHPADWTVSAAKGSDTYAIKGRGNVVVTRYPVATIDDVLLGSHLVKRGESPRVWSREKLDGEPAIRMVFDTVDDRKRPVTVVDDVTLRGGNGYEVYGVTAREDRGEMDTFDQFAATFAFVD